MIERLLLLLKNKKNLFLFEDSSIYMRITTWTVVSFLLGKGNVLQRSLVWIPNRTIERKALLIVWQYRFVPFEAF